jgi:hypothetical protein
MGALHYRVQLRTDLSSSSDVLQLARLRTRQLVKNQGPANVLAN